MDSPKTDNDTLLHKKDSEIQALKSNLEDLASKLTDANLDTAAAHMKTQHVLTINLSHERNMRKRNQLVETYKNEIKKANDWAVEERRKSCARSANFEKVYAALAEENDSLKDEIKRLKESIESKDADGLDLAMQIRYKADELHGMTEQIEAGDRRLARLQEEFELLTQAYDDMKIGNHGVVNGEHSGKDGAQVEGEGAEKMRTNSLSGEYVDVRSDVPSSG